MGRFFQFNAKICLCNFSTLNVRNKRELVVMKESLGFGSWLARNKIR